MSVHELGLHGEEEEEDELRRRTWSISWQKSGRKEYVRKFLLSQDLMNPCPSATVIYPGALSQDRPSIPCSDHEISNHQSAPLVSPLSLAWYVWWDGDIWISRGECSVREMCLVRCCESDRRACAERGGGGTNEIHSRGEIAEWRERVVAKFTGE